MKGAIIDGGGATHRALQSPGQPFFGLQPVPIEHMAATNLEDFDAVIVPRSCDGDALYARRHQIARFLDRGGLLVAFGEIWTDWLPGARWEPEAAQDTRPPTLVADHPLLEELGGEDLWWHKEPGGWCCHGHVRIAEGAEPLVATPDGGTWFYVDRSSTRGTIICASNLDLDTHAFHGSETARTLLERLMSWVRAEVARRPRARTASDRIAGYFSGVYFQHRFFAERTEQFVLVPAAELAALDLAAYPALWIPRESHQRTLEENAVKIERYLQGGGRVVSLEEIDRPWLPGASWQARQVDIERVAKTDHPLVDALRPMRRPWHGHGVLQVPRDAEVLISDDHGGMLLATWRVGKGSVLAGTIDGDSHAGYGSTIPDAFVNELVAWARGAVPASVG